MSAGAIVVGAGLAGSEACWQLARRGIPTALYEMRPETMTPAHSSGRFGELVCSNSLGSKALKVASGLLKEELRTLGSLVIKCADRHEVPAGGALAVDRLGFAESITDAITSQALVTVVRDEIESIPDSSRSPVIIATGPLTSESLAKDIRRFTGRDALFFYDAASPIVSTDSIDMTRAFKASRYDGEQGDYVNCPMTREEYLAFYDALVNAETAVRHAFEVESHFFEGCLPVEEIARRGVDTLRYGPMKPVGLLDPASGTRPYAVVQLRQDDKDGRMYNIVGFQTSLKWGEQDRVFRMIPALRQAEFLRYGVMHRNTYIHSPSLLKVTMEARDRPGLFFAGQIVGVEGYVESVAMGYLAGVNAASMVLGKEPVIPPATTMIGALARYVSSPSDRFQPMNANWGLLPSIEMKKRGKKYRNEALAKRSLVDIQSIL